MRPLAVLLWGLWISTSGFAQEPSLESLESLGEDLQDQRADGKPPAAPGINVRQREMKPASDTTGVEPIDIRSRIKKISEPNLFAGAPPNPGALRNLTAGEAPEEYAVHPGDTLYDICDQLIDEAKYWPKLWAFNPNIANPHFVYPGMRLRFYAGDNESPPFLQVITEDDILPVAKGKVVESELVRENISGMLMRSEIPETMSLLDPKDLANNHSIDGMFIDAGGRYNLDTKPVIIPAFVVEDELEELGEVVGGSAGSFLVDKGQQVIVKQKEEMKLGTTYSIVRRGEKVRSSDHSTIGIRYEFIAQIKIDVQDGEDEDVFKGSIILNRLGVQPGDLVVSYRSVKRTVPTEPEVSARGLQQEVVGFTERLTHIGGRGAFVFIDQSEGRLQEKETYAILQNVKVSASVLMRDKLPDTDSKVARVYIIDSSGSAALGYLTRDSFEVRLGDRIAP